MSSTWQRGGRRGRTAAAAAIALLALVGAVMVGVGLYVPTRPPNAEVTAAASPQPADPGAGSRGDAAPAPGQGPAAGDRPDLGPALPGSRPVALDIPSIGVRSTTIVGLGLAEDGSLEVPRDPDHPGWFTPGPSPGQLGPAVIAGHVDSSTGPAVFYRLGEMRPGSRIRVTREDGSVAAFTVDRVETYEKDEFPTREVYGNTTNRAELRLITCSGEYDDERGYLSNTVAFAHLSG